MSQEHQAEDCPDLDNRDRNNEAGNLDCVFEDIFHEPNSQHSLDCVWKNSYKCFNCGKNCCYKFLSTLCGIFIALYWGCEFAIITFDTVWCINPCFRIFSIYMGCAQKFFGSCVMCLCAPICETCGLCFSRIAVKNM